jgi:hypothetical protein
VKSLRDYGALTRALGLDPTNQPWSLWGDGVSPVAIVDDVRRGQALRGSIRMLQRLSPSVLAGNVSCVLIQLAFGGWIHRLRADQNYIWDVVQPTVGTWANVDSNAVKRSTVFYPEGDLNFAASNNDSAYVVGGVTPGAVQPFQRLELGNDPTGAGIIFQTANSEIVAPGQAPIWLRPNQCLRMNCTAAATAIFFYVDWEFPAAGIDLA